MPEGGQEDSQVQSGEMAERPHELIRFNTTGGYLGGALQTLREKGHPEFEEKVRNTAVGEASKLTDEELKVIEEILEPEHQFSGFMSGYAAARWGGENASAVWRGADGYKQENIAAKFWWRLSPEERNNFYLRMSRNEAEAFWNANKLDEGESPVKIEINPYQSPQQ